MKSTYIRNNSATKKGWHDCRRANPRKIHIRTHRQLVIIGSSESEFNILEISRPWVDM